MRAVNLSPGVRWTLSNILYALSSPPEDLFLAIHTTFCRASSSDDSTLNDLLKELDYPVLQYAFSVNQAGLISRV